MARRPRKLTSEERELWARVARTASTVYKSETKAEENIPPSSPPSHSKPARNASDHITTPSFRVGQTVTPLPKSRANISTSPAERLAEQPLRMDHKLHKRMRQGKLMPDARLDLHGMTLARAQPALVNFIFSCRANQMRLVLVITGKGRGDHGPLPTRPGALRHIVPEWLRQAPLSIAVQQITTAHFRHGGEGAYYVYLRK